MESRFLLEGLDCAHCAEMIRNAVAKEHFCDNATINFITKELTVIHDGKISDKALLQDVSAVVKKFEPDVKTRYVDDNDNEKESKTAQIVIIIISSVLFIAGLLTEFLITDEKLSEIISLCCYALSFIPCALPVIVKSIKSIISKNIFNENTLMLVASIGAVCIRQFEEAVAVMLFYRIGEFVQSLAVNKSRRSIAALIKSKPETAELLVDSRYVTVNPSDVEKGSIIRVRAGEKIPLDGVIISGSTSVNNSAITGESAPIDVSEGDFVNAGGINLSGTVNVKTTASFTDSTVYKMLEIVQTAIEKKTKTENFISVFAKYYTPVVVLMAVIIGVIPPLLMGLDFGTWIKRGLIFLVISCPCALVISVPLGYFAGIGKASSDGILIKGSNYLEAVCKIKTVLFDKTGTLTKGEFKVCDVVPHSVTKEELLEYDAYCEYNSTHPIGIAVKNAYSKSYDLSRISSCEEIAGKGIKAEIDGKTYLCGNAKFLAENSIATDNATGTALYLACGNEYLGYITVADIPKETSAECIKLLKDKGIRVIMLTGDNASAAKITAEALGITEYYSSLLPQDKSEIALKAKNELKKNEKIAFIGDGINDSPVLATCDIGIAMGKGGSDSAIETADIVLMQDNPKQLITAYEISRKTKDIVMQNIVFALAIKFIIQILGVLGLANMWAAVFADVGVTVLAICNSLRLLRKQNTDRLHRF